MHVHTYYGHRSSATQGEHGLAAKLCRSRAPRYTSWYCRGKMLHTRKHKSEIPLDLGLKRSSCCCFAGQRLAQKDLLHRHRYQWGDGPQALQFMGDIAMAFYMSHLMILMIFMTCSYYYYYYYYYYY